MYKLLREKTNDDVAQLVTSFLGIRREEYKNMYDWMLLELVYQSKVNEFVVFLKDVKMSFGKYHGCSLSEVIQDEKYIKWVIAMQARFRGDERGMYRVYLIAEYLDRVDNVEKVKETATAYGRLIRDSRRHS